MIHNPKISIINRINFSCMLPGQCKKCKIGYSTSQISKGKQLIYFYILGEYLRCILQQRLCKTH